MAKCWPGQVVESNKKLLTVLLVTEQQVELPISAAMVEKGYLPDGCHDIQAEYYDQKVRESLDDYIRENYFAILDRVIEYAEFSDGMAVLDIGVGTGLLTERMPKGLDLFGIDISSKMLDKLREKDLAIKLSAGGFLNIPFPDSSFDRVVSTFALHHLTPEQSPQAFKEISRVLKPDGRFVIGDFMVEGDMTFFRTSSPPRASTALA